MSLRPIVRGIKTRIRASLVRAARVALSEHSARVAQVDSRLSNEIEALAEAHDQTRREAGAQFERLTTSAESLREQLTRTRQIVGGLLDDIPALRRGLRLARESSEYQRAYEDPEPLVSVRIATYNQADLLIERAIASVLKQSYERLEIVVVGDGCTDQTGDRLARIGDPRIRFVNLPFRWPYPSNKRHRWLIAGSPAMNVGAQLAQGSWIAPLDDDDEFTPDHVEVLLNASRKGSSEMTYGQIQIHSPDDSRNEQLCVYPPAYEHFGFQAAIYLGSLRFFEYNTNAWMLDESGDWNLCRRMLEAGVKIGFVDRVVTEYYPSSLYRDTSR